MPYLVIEGQDATGKTTQAHLLAEYLRARGEKVLEIGEPEGVISGPESLSSELEAQIARSGSALEQIRSLVKDRRYDLQPMTYALLFTAARVEIAELISLALAEEYYVVAARNWYSTLAYQGYGQGMNLRHIKEITRHTVTPKYLRPDGVVILMLPEEERLRRQKLRGENVAEDTFESKGQEFQESVDRAYLEIASGQAARIVEVSGGLEEVQLEIRKVLGV